MTEKVRIKTIVAVFLLLLLVISTFLLISRKENPNIYSRLATEEEKEKYTEYIYDDYSKSLFYNNSPAAVDIETSSIYLSVSEPSLKDDRIFVNLLYLSDMEDKELLFVLDEEHSDVSSCVSENRPFKLIVADVGSESYMEYNVFFSTLPIIRLEGGVVGKNDLRRPIYEGDFSIWDANSKDEELLKTSVAQWNIRGGSSTHYEKKSFKLSLIKRNEENSMSLLDLGTDDVWILNSMVIDDLKIREMFTMDVWNSMQDSSSYNLKMSTARYVEVVIDGKYEGLYLLQRKIDETYLDLPKNSVLLRGDDRWTIDKLQEAYKIEYSYRMPDANIYENMAGLFYMNDFSNLCIENWIDMNLYVQFGNMADNTWLKNSYYTINANGNGEICIIPWDTDASFGIVWGSNDFIINYSQIAKEMIITRAEYKNILEMIPNLKQDIDERWCELRKSVLSNENVRTMINKHYSVLNMSGALIRDLDENGQKFSESGTISDFTDFVTARLEAMDVYYNYK